MAPSPNRSHMQLEHRNHEKIKFLVAFHSLPFSTEAMTDANASYIHCIAAFIPGHAPLGEGRLVRHVWLPFFLPLTCNCIYSCLHTAMHFNKNKNKNSFNRLQWSTGFQNMFCCCFELMLTRGIFFNQKIPLKLGY